MLILPATKKVITQTDWWKITAERSRMQTDDGKIIIDEKYEKNWYFKMNQKFIVIILLMSLSEDMFIFISSFVFGYCVGYYSYNFFKPKSLKDEIIDFILR